MTTVSMAPTMSPESTLRRPADIDLPPTSAPHSRPSRAPQQGASQALHRLVTADCLLHARLGNTPGSAEVESRQSPLPVNREHLHRHCRLRCSSGASISPIPRRTPTDRLSERAERLSITGPRPARL